MSAGYLDSILETTRERVRRQQTERSLGDLEREATAALGGRDFVSSLRGADISIIAEIKRRSPSAGDIAPQASVESVAAEYVEGGASALSVLTEPHFFGGSIDDLRAAREACGLPVLRKDFIVDTYQVVESRAAGADAVLLIVSALPDQARFLDLAAAAAQWEVPVLFEIHDEWEIDRAFEANPAVIGINQRNLLTFEVQAGLAEKLRQRIPGEVLVVAESGFSTSEQVKSAQSAGVNAVLIGETLMRAKDRTAKLQELRGRSD